WRDLGHSHECSLARDENGTLVGVWLRHECAKKPSHGRETDVSTGFGAFIPFAGGMGYRNPWTLVSEDPLTITPSVHFVDCGEHGFITAGRWVPA
ncbi:MAG: hypothetical protein Q8S03_02850, partial [Brevundimonas sp.]|uniref:hypothetical protein n=1 Tax=Brevundimonas sp. TaxID=1871086 RepID=UPI0027331706